MKKILTTSFFSKLNLLKTVTFALGLGVLPCSAMAEFDCSTIPTCGSMGFLFSEEDCGDAPVLRCPFDSTKVTCAVSSEKKCQFGDVVYDTNKCYHFSPEGNVKGIVIDPETRIALALEYAVPAPVPAMKFNEVPIAYDNNVFNAEYTSYYGNSYYSHDTPFIPPQGFNPNTGVINTASRFHFNPIYKPDFKPLVTEMDAAKLCTGDWFLPHLGAFAYPTNQAERQRYILNTRKFMSQEAGAGKYQGRPEFLWTSNLYYNRNAPQFIAVTRMGSTASTPNLFIHYVASENGGITNNLSLVHDLMAAIEDGSYYSAMYMVRCATRY